MSIAGAIEISDLDPGTSLDGSEVIPADQGGNTVRITSQQLANKVVSDINANPSVLTAFIVAVAAAVALSSSTETAQLSFTSTTGKNINWQTDSPDGETRTFAQVLGNKMPKPSVWASDGFASEFQNISFDCRVVRSFDNSTILTVSFDWAISQTGFITF